MEGRPDNTKEERRWGSLEGLRQLGEAERGVQRRPGEGPERAGRTAHSDGGCGTEESREGKESA